MNYLAHAYLSRESPEALIGGLLGDFVKGPIPMQWGAEVAAAISRHRALDRFTDAHAVPAASRALISPERRRFAGVLVDVFYDHFLARHWPRFSPEPLDRFSERVYAALWPRRGEFPARLQQVLPRMIADDWLASYGEIEAVDAVLNGIARRLQRYPRATVLRDAVSELEWNYGELERQFLEFFSCAIEFTRGQAAGSPRAA